MSDDHGHEVLIAIGKLEGTLDGMAKDIAETKTDVGKQYSLLQKQNGRLTKLETINEEQDKQDAKNPVIAPVAPAAVDEEAIAIRYIKKHGQGAMMGAGGLGTVGGVLILIAYLVRWIVTGEPPPPTP